MEMLKLKREGGINITSWVKLAKGAERIYFFGFHMVLDWGMGSSNNIYLKIFNHSSRRSRKAAACKGG